MPTYGYQCTECKHEFSAFQSMKDEPIASCPKCGAPVKRLLYPVGIVFKGSGWYINDSRPAEKSDASGPDTPKKDGAATDSTPSSDKAEKTEKSEKVEKTEPPAPSSNAA